MAGRESVSADRGLIAQARAVQENQFDPEARPGEQRRAIVQHLPPAEAKFQAGAGVSGGRQEPRPVAAANLAYAFRRHGPDAGSGSKAAGAGLVHARQFGDSVQAVHFVKPPAGGRVAVGVE